MIDRDMNRYETGIAADRVNCYHHLFDEWTGYYYDDNSHQALAYESNGVITFIEVTKK